MKKRFFAALAASVMLCGVLTAPAAAETTYKKGDVNMDGEVSVEDVMPALIDYTEYLVARKQHTLTEEQLELADVNGLSMTYRGRTSSVTVEDAYIILLYYTECVADAKLKDTDIVTWLRSTHPAWLEPKDAGETVN